MIIIALRARQTYAEGIRFQNSFAELASNLIPKSPKGDLIPHTYFRLLLPNPFSVPFNKRLILDLCFTMMNTPTTTQRII